MMSVRYLKSRLTSNIFHLPFKETDNLKCSVTVKAVEVWSFLPSDGRICRRCTREGLEIRNDRSVANMELKARLRARDKRIAELVAVLEGLLQTIRESPQKWYGSGYKRRVLIDEVEVMKLEGAVGYAKR